MKIIKLCCCLFLKSVQQCWQRLREESMKKVVIGVRVSIKDREALRKMGAPFLRKPSTEAALAVLNHIEKHKGNKR